MTAEETIRQWVLNHWSKTPVETAPFRHWLLSGALPSDFANGFCALPVEPPAISDTLGKRETHNATRWFFTETHRKAFPICQSFAAAFQHPVTVAMLEGMTGANLGGASLRIEFCQDGDGFWLEPHTDIGAKRFTALVYLSEMAGAETLGTDLFDSCGCYCGSAPGGFNRGLVFVPDSKSWHGFRKRGFSGVRKSLIINYVGPEWRARHELAFPDASVRAY